MQTQFRHRPFNRDARYRFLPYLFGADYLNAELNIYAYANRYLSDYDGGEWLFYTLPYGGGYLAPAEDIRLTLCNPDNGFQRTISADAAGMFITAMVLNHRCWMHSHHDEEDLCTLFSLRFEQLRTFIRTHPERTAILAALD